LFLNGDNHIPLTGIVNLYPRADIERQVRAIGRPPGENMEAILNRAPASRHIEPALTQWLHANRRLARSVARAAWDALIATSRAGLLVENRSRRRHRL